MLLKNNSNKNVNLSAIDLYGFQDTENNSRCGSAWKPSSEMGSFCAKWTSSPLCSIGQLQKGFTLFGKLTYFVTKFAQRLVNVFLRVFASFCSTSCQRLNVNVLLFSNLWQNNHLTLLVCRVISHWSKTYSPSPPLSLFLASVLSFDLQLLPRPRPQRLV